MEIQEELNTIRERNRRVEANKAWETSMFRKLLVATITYVIAATVMYAIGVSKFYLNALIPTIGFLLSTLTIPTVKRWWIHSS